MALPPVPARADADAEPNRRLVSTSGIPHADVADYRASPYWRKGMPRGITRSWRTALDDVIGRIAREDPGAVLHTGDMVEGRWGRDFDKAGVFGPTRTFAQRRRAVVTAAEVYYPQMKALWARHGLHPDFGMGDHEYGDIGRDGRFGRRDLRHRALTTWRWRWARHFTDNGRRYRYHPARGQHTMTAYARRFGDMGIVTVDPVQHVPSGTRVKVSRRQLQWMRHVIPRLRADGARWILVQSEVPALGPNRARGTSGLLLANAGAFWELLVDLEVDLLLAGEFHHMTTHSNAGRAPVQVVHGSSLALGHANWLVVDSYDDRLELTLRRMKGRVTSPDKIWSPSRRRAPLALRMDEVRTVGTMTLHADGATSDRTGFLKDSL